ncbi:MAG TPA: acyl-CoA dehydrogenase family protein [Bacteroidales bacterium]|nr:acyl-CoA dehydrogenase family protein [Bacteroidales bacterium]
MIRSPFLNNEHNALRDRVRKFAEEVVKPMAGQLDETEEFSIELTAKMGDMGFFGIQVPKELGGQGLDTLSYMIIVEELARVDSSQAATIAAVNSLAIAPILKYGTPEQIKKYIPPLCTGRMTWAFGLTEEHAGSDAMGSRTTAKLEDGFWVINGEKRHITNSTSEISGGVIVQAVTSEENGRKKLSAIIVEKDTPGFTRQRSLGKLMWRASDTGRLYFDNVRVPASNLLGEVGQGGRIMLNTLDSGRLSVAAIGVGLAQGAFEAALGHAKKREQFGQPIHKFQGVSFKLADMDMKIELARNMLYQATWKKDTGMQFAREAAMAKLYSSEIASEIADEAVQVLGATGVYKPHPVERFFRDQRLLKIGEGTSEVLRMVIARYLGL